MSNSLVAQGTIHTIGATTEYGQNGFTKREFVIKLTGENENADYPNYVAFELIKDKCAFMDQYQPGMEIKVCFNLQGRLWQGEGKPEQCFNALQAWKIESTGQAQQAPAPMAAPVPAPAPMAAPQPAAPQPIAGAELLLKYQQCTPVESQAMWANLNPSQKKFIADALA